MERERKNKGIIGIVLTASTFALALGLTITAVSARNFISLWWSSLMPVKSTAIEKSEDDIVKDFKEVSIETEQEGVVLYKNNNNVLPLQNNAKVNIFGYYGTKTQTSVATSASIGSEDIITIGLKDGLEEAGLQVNDELFDYQTTGVSNNGVTKAPNFFSMSGTWTIKEFDYDAFVTDGYIDQAKQYSNTAIYVVARSASEKGDAPIGENAMGEKGEGYHYYQFTETEQKWIDNLSANFENLIVLYNSNSAMNLDWVNSEKIDAFLQIGTTGTYGTIGVGKVLNGTVSPSGKAHNTWVKDVTDNPAFYTYGKNEYANSDQWDEFSDGYTNPSVLSNKTTAVDANTKYYYHYYEGIYEGYRYYETRWIQDDNTYTTAGEQEYWNHVVYPFGYGLSYTTFEWSNANFNVEGKGGKVTVSVDVKNTGSVAGKDVVQLYYSAPFIKGGVEKSAVVLGGYAKTKILNPGETERVSIEMNFDDMASYDYKGERAYILDSGNYVLSLRSDAHTVKNDLTYVYNLKSKIVYSDDKDGKRSNDAKTATNLFDEVSNGDTEEGITWVSRSDWEGTLPTVKDSEKPKITLKQSHVDFIKGETLGSYVTSPSKDEERAQANGWTKITTNAKNGTKIDQLAGLEDYDSPLWDDLLDNLSMEEMRTLYADGAYRVASAKSIGMNLTVDADAGQGLNATSISQYGPSSPGLAVSCSTFNDELMERMAASIAETFLVKGVVGVYGPTINLQASAFVGRASECGSEDPILSGKIVAAYCRGFQGRGGYVYMKHFAFYRMCGNASATNWLNEQSIREIYTKQFEIGVKEGNARGMMISFSRIGTSLNTCSENLLTDLARGEWGFQGCFVSDGVGPTEWDVNMGVRAGLDLCLNASLDSQMVSYAVSAPDKTITESITGQNLLRESAKRLVYRYANSAAIATQRDFTPTWIIPVVVIDTILVGIGAASVFTLVLPMFKKKDN